MQKIVLATSNQGKYKEISAVLNDMPYKFVLQNQCDVTSPAETGFSFVENAIIKARHAASVTQMPAIADDSGIAVDALGGEPGIYSSRFAGPNADDAKNIAKMLDRMQEVPKEKRNASFHCVMVVMRHAYDPTPLICQGYWPGEILFEPRGLQGFGYDPIFFVPSENKSAAELDAQRKNQISHRAQALQQLAKQLPDFLA